MKLDERALEAAAKAMHDYQVNMARKAIEDTDFDSSEMPVIFRRLHGETETSQVLVVSSYLEDRFVSLLSNQMLDMHSEDAKDRVFGNNGPLGTFSSRITMSYHLGWLKKDTLDRLNNFRKIRNIFAHQAFSVSYTDRRVRSLFAPLIKRLKFFDGSAVVAAIEASDGASLRRIVDATESRRNLCSLALLVGDVCRDLLVLPEALRYQVGPGAICGSFDDGPKVLNALTKNMIRCVLEGLVIEDNKGSASGSEKAERTISALHDPKFS